MLIVKLLIRKIGEQLLILTYLIRALNVKSTFKMSLKLNFLHDNLLQISSGTSSISILVLWLLIVTQLGLCIEKTCCLGNAS